MNYRTGTPEYFLTPAKALVFDSITTINDSSLLQKLQYKNFVTDNSISFSVTKNRFIITPKVKYRFTQNKLESSIFENEVSQVIKNNWINDIVLRSNVKQYDLNIDYKGEKLMITSSFPLNYYSIQLEDNRQPVQNTSKWAIEPNLELLYKVNLYWEAKLAAGRTVRFSDIKELTRGNIMSELNQSSHQNGIAETISHSISQGINYKNPFSNIFISTSYSCYWVFSNTMPGVNFLQNGQTFFEQLNQQNTTVMQSANFRVGKFFTKSNTNISISFGGNKMQSQFLFNNNFSNSNIYSYNTMLNLVTGAFDKFYIDISGVYYKSHRNTIFNKSKATQFTTSSNILFTPYQNHAIKLSLNYSLGKFDHIDFYYNVFDLSYQFSMPKNKVDVEIRWNNISNQKIFNQTYIFHYHN